MSNGIINVTIKGLDKVLVSLDKFPDEIDRMRIATGNAVFRLVTRDRGGGKDFYPPETQANRPPPPYYERGVGTHTGQGVQATSEQMNNKFYFNVEGPREYISNTASYSQYPIGEGQTGRMAAIGWQKLIDSAREKIGQIVEIWEQGIDDIIKRLGL
jgi:hypothetical protein